MRKVLSPATPLVCVTGAVTLLRIGDAGKCLAFSIAGNEVRSNFDGWGTEGLGDHQERRKLGLRRIFGETHLPFGKHTKCYGFFFIFDG